MALTSDDFIEKWWRLARNVPMAEMKADLEEMMHEMGTASVQRYVMDQAALGQQAGFPFRDRLKDSL